MKACVASSANNRASSKGNGEIPERRRWLGGVGGGKWQGRGAWVDTRGVGIWDLTTNKSGFPTGMCRSDLPPPEAGGSLKSHLPILWLRAKEVVLQKLKWFCRIIQWATVGKDAHGVGPTNAPENCRSVLRCLYFIRKSKDGQEVIYESEKM